MTATLRQTVRRFARHPTFAATAVLVLGLGIGATTAMFSVVDAVLFRHPPWPDADRLVVIHEVRPDQRQNPALATTWDRSPISWAAWLELRKSSAFDEVGVWMPGQQIFGSDRSDLVTVYYASSSFLSVLGVKASSGRLFTPDDDDTMSDAIVVSHEAWQRRFGSRPDVVGQTTGLAYTHRSRTETKTIVGVLPPGFRFQGESPEFLLPMGLMAHNGSFENNRFLRVVGRLARDVSIEQAQTIAEPLVRRLDSPDRRSARVLSLIQDRFGTIARPLWLLLAAASLLLVIACSNVAGLLLVDASVRRDEMTVRVALGATRLQLMRQLAVEYVVLALAASAAGVLLAHWFTPVLVAMGPTVIRDVESISVNYRIASWSLALGSATALLFGVAPALTLSGTPARSTLSQAAARAGAHRFIVAGQIALALVLVVCAGLFGQTLLQLGSRSIGFEPAGVVVATIKLTRPVAPIVLSGSATTPGPGLDRRAAKSLMNASWMHTDALIERLARLPGVLAVAGASGVPFSGTASVTSVRESGGPADDHSLRMRTVTEDYFQVMGIPIVSGRGLVAADRDIGSPYWAVVSREEERRLAHGIAVGKRLEWAGYPLEIVGVVGEVRHAEDSDLKAHLPTLYLVNFRAEQINHILVRTSGDARHALPTIRRVIQEYDPSIQVTAMASLSDLIADSMTGERFRAFLSTVFGTVALALAAVGLFGLTSYLVARRRQELAVRIALGAGASDVRRLVLRDVAIIVAMGFAVGTPAAYGASLAVRSSLFGVSEMPIAVLLSGLVVLCVAATVAVAVPVLRAGRIDPVQLLKS